MRYRFLRLFAVALVTLGLAATPALAVSTTVRIAGDTIGGTAVVNTPSANVPGMRCAGSSAAGALDVATAGNWDRQEFVSTILGESHAYAHSDYWAFWVNGSYSQVGACDYTVQAGDELLFYVQRDGPGFVGTVFPLYFSSVPAAVTAGAPFTVRVVRHVSDGNTTTPTPIAGATVTDGAGATATTGADGTATLVLGTPGTAKLQATAPASVPTPLATVAVSAAPVTEPGPAPPAPPAPGEPTPPAEPSTAAPPADRSAPLALIAGLRNGQHFSRRGAPRELHGTVADQGAVKQVQLRLERKRGKGCSSFSADRERFVKRSCGRGAAWFDAGDDASWSYLLPKRLGRGLYQLQVRATDAAGNRSTNASVRFRVR
ncbi:DUF4430 domain-containing protein [Capillimicrobium parvum]|uniref:DUF4430 domain-containing protein n=1 Tax=Capillimicrobium parvum TaxID=2884022 RepID=A0A9E6XVY2_9ACTN|nr:DUF4430 domain-containing protein [Capillimicrobium parvum]UGS35389.1 hypothetical protein DSM104329_01777 [Capillimicrobium parvum]